MDEHALPVIVMEKMEHSLRNLVEKYDKIPLNVKLSILDNVCLGLMYLHSRNPPIVHRDLTPNNILLSQHLEAKISDLGVAKTDTTNTRTMTRVPGTVDFMPPECLADRPVYGLPLDIFSYGGVILFTTIQEWPQPASWIDFDTDTGMRMVLSEVQRRKRYLDRITGGATHLKPLVISCLGDNPKNRPIIEDIYPQIKKVKDMCSQMHDRDKMSTTEWLAEVQQVSLFC